MTEDENKLIAQRREKLQAMRATGNAFPNDFKPEHKAGALQSQHANTDKEQLAEQGITVSIAGRMMSRRVMGKASFAGIRDVSGDIQLFLQQGQLGEELYADFKTWDIGDIVGATGTLFITKTGELSIKAKLKRR